MAFPKILECFQPCREKVEAKAAVGHRSVHQRHHRTQSVLRRRPPHPGRLTGDGRIALSHTFVAPFSFTSDKKSRWDIKFVRWLFRKNRDLSCPCSRRMTKSTNSQTKSLTERTTALCRSDLQACQVDADMGRQENQENSGCTTSRRDQDFHRH